MVRENGSRIVVASKPVSGVEEGGQEEPQEGVAEPRTVPEGAGGGLLARTELDVRVTFAVEDGKRTVDERAVEGARTLATDLMNLWPSLDVNVEVREVAVFAEPRRVWPPENDGS